MPLSTFAILIAAGIVLLLRKARYNYERLPKIPYVSGANMPDVSIIIPARNEQATLPRLLATLPEERVTVVDDHSEDQTAAIAREAGVRVIPAPELMPGRLGKPNACAAGAAERDSEWLLFVDADTRYERVFLPSLGAYAEQEELDMISVFLHRETGSLAERIVLPYAFALYFTGVSVARVNGRPPSEWLANGQCLFIRRRSYVTIGGHDAVAGSVIEDVALAKLAARAGVRSRVVRAEHLGSVRMYDSLGAIVRGFEKNSFRFLLENKATAVQVIAASILLTSWLPIVAGLAWEGEARLAVLFGAVPTLVLFPWYRGVSALLAPAAIYLFQGVALRSLFLWLTGRPAVWKGRPV